MEEGKALNHLIHTKERIICLLKSLEHQREISEKEKNDLYSSGSKPGVKIRENFLTVDKFTNLLKSVSPSVTIVHSKGNF